MSLCGCGLRRSERNPRPAGGSRHHATLATTNKGVDQSLERQPQRGPFQDLADLLLQRVDGHSLDVEVDVLRISDALEEEAQVAATLDGEAILVRPRAEEADEVQVKELHYLAVQ